MTYLVMLESGKFESTGLILTRAVALAKLVDGHVFTSDYRPVAICDDFRQVVPSMHATADEAKVVRSQEMTKLDEFISLYWHKGRRVDGRLMSKNAYVDFPGFDALYVRVTSRYIRGEWYDAVDLANLNATKPGNGAFTALFEHLKQHYPNLGIYVENVQIKRFAQGLLRLGFQVVSENRLEWDGTPLSFWFPGQVPSQVKVENANGLT
jgi:hypothetical protein